MTKKNVICALMSAILVILLYHLTQDILSEHYWYRKSDTITYSTLMCFIVVLFSFSKIPVS